MARHTHWQHSVTDSDSDQDHVSGSGVAGGAGVAVLERWDGWMMVRAEWMEGCTESVVASLSPRCWFLLPSQSQMAKPWRGWRAARDQGMGLTPRVPALSSST